MVSGRFPDAHLFTGHGFCATMQTIMQKQLRSDGGGYMITVADVMKLPSMYGSEIIAGHGGLANPVESITVLEYGKLSDTLDTLFSHTQFSGNELLISSFANIQDDVAAQCENIRRYHATGASGIILFYIGIIMPKIDPALIECCNQLDFALICMPKDASHKYGDVIGDVSYALFRDQQSEKSFVSDLIGRFSKLDTHQKNLDTLLRMLSNHLQASVILTDCDGHICNIAAWPRTMAPTVEANAAAWLQKIGTGAMLSVTMGDSKGYLQYCPPLLDGAAQFGLYLFCYNEPLSRKLLWQASELIQLYSHIYNENLGRFVTSELIEAIIDNQPLKMNRLAKLFHLEVATLNQMWVFLPQKKPAARDTRFLNQCSHALSAVSSTVLAGYYGEQLVAFCSASVTAQERQAAAADFLSSLGEKLLAYQVVCADCLDTTEDVNRIYFDIVKFADAARSIFPCKAFLRTTDILFARLCLEALEDKKTLSQYLSVIKKLNAGTDVLPTVMTYLLDASASTAQTARLLCCHLNTVKYRLRLVKDALGYSPSEMPDALPLCIAVAIYRLQGGKPE